nr:hypothetical protein [Frankia sp. Mgl5]
MRAVPVVGLLGCLLLAFSLPGTSVLGGSAVLVAAAGDDATIKIILDGRMRQHC